MAHGGKSSNAEKQKRQAIAKKDSARTHGNRGLATVNELTCDGKNSGSRLKKN